MTAFPEDVRDALRTSTVAACPWLASHRPGGRCWVCEYRLAAVTAALDELEVWGAHVTWEVSP